MNHPNRISWTDTLIAAARDGERTTAWEPPADQLAELEAWCVSYRLPHADPNRVAIATIYPAERRGAVATNGDSRWGEYLPARGGIAIDESDETILVHESTDTLVGRVARECVAGWLEAGDWARAPGETYRDWRAQVGVPASGDLDALRSAVRELTGRAPTDAEEGAFTDAIHSQLWDALPVRAPE